MKIVILAGNTEEPQWPAAEMRNAPADDEYLRQCGRELSEILGLETDT